jgi:hypothetical protein
MENKSFTYGTWKYEKNPRLGIAMPAAKTIRFYEIYFVNTISSISAMEKKTRA